eukprot:TRINITY_DN5674_c0_g1_i1.p1 TRINITY_DN5674_c0_g1~~TRINITY_DN5674_c0_g1_i1.p1  ORF type:complete len:434 (+),score=114.82 TRINITY_DN5674_c0_g1_i1:68-1303(+)
MGISLGSIGGGSMIIVPIIIVCRRKSKKKKKSKKNKRKDRDHNEDIIAPHDGMDEATSAASSSSGGGYFPSLPSFSSSYPSSVELSRTNGSSMSTISSTHYHTGTAPPSSSSRDHLYMSASEDLKISGGRNYNISFNEIRLDPSPIAAGNFGAVYKAVWRGAVVAVKQLHNLSVVGLADFQKEALTMMSLMMHPNVILLYGVVTEPQPMIVTEFIAGGSLLSRLMDSSFVMTLSMAREAIMGVANGMAHLHAQGILHRDLAARNILVGSGWTMKVGDFGMSRTIMEEGALLKTRNNFGPLKWMAPESIKHQVYSNKSDVFSFGVLMWEILARRQPHHNLTTEEAGVAVCGGQRLEILPSFPRDLALLMQQCWATNPDDRPDFTSIRNTLASQMYRRSKTPAPAPAPASLQS